MLLRRELRVLKDSIHNPPNNPTGRPWWNNAAGGYPLDTPQVFKGLLEGFWLSSDVPHAGSLFGANQESFNSAHTTRNEFETMRFRSTVSMGLHE